MTLIIDDPIIFTACAVIMILASGLLVRVAIKWYFSEKTRFVAQLTEQDREVQTGFTGI